MEEKEKLIKWPDLPVVNYRTTTGLIQYYMIAQRIKGFKEKN